MVIDEIRDVASLDGQNGVQTRQRGCEALGFLTARMERVRAFDLKVARLPSQRRRPHLAMRRRLCNSDVAALAPLTRSIRQVVVLEETGRSTAILITRRGLWQRDPGLPNSFDCSIKVCQVPVTKEWIAGLSVALRGFGV